MNLTATQKRQRLLMMVSGTLIMFFTGVTHIWSIFQPYAMKEAGWTQGQASLCFYLAFATFVFGNIVGGHIQDKGHPRIAVIIGGALFFVGFFLSAFLIIPSPIPIYLTYGVMQGFGQGMIYTTIISTAQKWFPERTGFASGIVITVNGLCGFFLSPLSRVLIEQAGLSKTFIFIGSAIGIAWILSSIFFCAPDENWRKKAEEKASKKKEATENVNGKQYTSSEMMHTKSFYFLFATMLFGLVPYFMVSPVSQTHQIGLGIPANIAVSAVMIGSIVNACTRLALPTLADKVGRVICIKIALIISVIAMIVLAVSGAYPVTVAIVIIYGCYGGIMGSFPSFTSSVFGITHSGENYGYVMFGIVIATLGVPALTGFMTGNGMNMQMVFAVGAVFAGLAFGSLQLLQKELKKGEI